MAEFEEELEETFDDPFEHPMYAGRVGGLDAYLVGGEDEEEDPLVVLSDPLALDPMGLSPVPMIEKLMDADLKRHIRAAERRAAKKAKEESTPAE